VLGRLGRSRALARRATLGTVAASMAVVGLPALAQAERPAPPANPCAVPSTQEIGAVQGSEAATPVAGQRVTVRGTVVGDVEGFNGFYLQDEDGDGDPATSDGIFVFSSVPVDLGDTVAVTGAAGEFGGQTQIRARTDAEVCADGTAADLPPATPLDLPADDVSREQLEGMLVSPADTLTVSEVFDLTSFGELTLSADGLLVQPTELARPGTPEAAAIAAGNTLRRIVLDDGVSARVSTTTRPYLSPATPVRVGDELAFTSPLVLGHGFDQWRLQPADGTADGTFAPQNTRHAAPDEVGGDIQLGAFNVLNYFLTLEAQGGRGATTAEEFEEQAGKIVPAIEALGADVVTLMEIEDTDSTGYSPGDADQAIAELVGRLDVAAGYDKWSYVPLPDELYAVDRDVIRSAIIYQPGVVQRVGDSVGLVDESVWDNAREPIAQTFTKDGDAFTVVANHFKSKSPGASTGDNADAGDGQGQWNGDRKRQAASLAEFTEDLRTATGERDVVLLGDFNAYTQEDPVEVLRDAGYTDLGSELDPDGYSYVFDDMSGSLDHALATAGLADKVTGFAHWNINAVESLAYQYVGDPALYAPNPYRSSDHDPLVLGIDLEGRCHGLLPTIRGTDGDDVLRGGYGRDVITLS
jgi:predicted extracellular nuclease